jgi:hypothetical protein
MEKNQTNNRVLVELAMIVDATQQVHRGKSTIIFEVDKTEFEETKKNLQISAQEEDKFKIDISGTEVIYLLTKKDES